MSETIEPPAPVVIPSLPQAKPLPWSFWPTTGLGFAIGFVFLSVQTAVAVIAVFAFNTDLLGEAEKIALEFERLAMDGRVLSVSMLVSFPVMLLGCLLFAKMRKGITSKNYFSLRPMRAGWWIGLPLFTIGFSLLMGWFLQWVGAPETNPFMLQMAKSVREVPLMLVGVVLFAPVAEEFLFRGFLFRGWEESRLRLAGTIVLTSVTWALIHGQYDVYGLIYIFVLGVVLGLSRVITKSLYGPILIHLVNNAFAMYMVMGLPVEEAPVGLSLFGL
ncbi:MAG: CPBP family intramembrane metalloprotease [Verrucomicrobiales bacterium]|nr:CPBP family intramembrane metalloprotease [Verrucomicrobiales bacterium]